ncbi:hypothetical protein OIV19_20220 [Brucella sp. HL-2]|nr:hypothetical protein [Brucella sp. HL-2]MCV9909929.1 hypothetical protein [Brucella sp. HL-2]
MNVEDFSIADVVSALVDKHPCISPHAAQEIGAAIGSERQRCADVANGWANDAHQTGEAKLVAAYIWRAIMKGEAA